nr:ATP-binding cassette domain-containing protein [Microlunatus antarcticus]
MSFSARLAARDFDVSLELGDHERLAVLGPNGAGKSTLLGILAGTVRPDSGRAELDGEVLFDVRAGRWPAPHRRRVGLLAQDPLLFPHLDVLANVAFGPRAAGVPRRTADAAARAHLATVEADGLATRRPAQLSGGQAQRVAIARAVATDPRLLLLDEPLAALDVTVAPLVRRVLRSVLTGRTTVLVTHDLLDALLLSDRVAVLEGGHLVETGPTAEVFRHPQTAFTARLAGLNLVLGVADATGVSTPAGLHVGAGTGGVAPGAPAAAVFAPNAVSVFVDAPHGSPRTVLRARVGELEPSGDDVRVTTLAATGESITASVTPASVGELDLYPGRDVFLAIKATAVTVYPV